MTNKLKYDKKFSILTKRVKTWRRLVGLAQDPKGEKIASKLRTPFTLNCMGQNVLPLPIPDKIRISKIEGEKKLQIWNLMHKPLR